MGRLNSLPVGSLPARFWAKVDKTETCWLWTAAISGGTGYGSFRFTAYTTQNAHRLAYLDRHGEVDPALELDHLCRVRHCCNPDHLEAVTHTVNVERGTAHDGRRSRTHCPQGHEYNEENTITYRGSRYCRECGRERGRRKDAERKAARDQQAA